MGVSREAVTKLVRRHGWRGEAVGRGRACRFPRSVAEQLVARRARGLGSQTVAYYWRELVAFCRWMVGPRQKRLPENPLAGVAGPDPRSDPRHDRRALSLDELLRLLEAARRSAWGYRGLTGPDRYFLYLTACATGLRRKELSALTPASFDLDGDPPTACLPGRRTKNKRPATQPLPPDVAAALRDYLRGRDPDAPVWPRKALREIVAALRHDLAEAGIPYVIDGPEGPLYADLHALRHSYVLLLDQAGVTVKQAMSLARHSDPKLTMARYGRPQLGDLGSAVNRLPSLTGRPQETGQGGGLRATGTDPAAAPALAPPLAPLAPKLAPTGDGRGECLRSFDAPAPSQASGECPSAMSSLRAPDGGREGLRVVDAGGPRRRTPGDRRRASSGEELVPNVRGGCRPARRARRRRTGVSEAGTPRHTRCGEAGPPGDDPARGAGRSPPGDLPLLCPATGRGGPADLRAAGGIFPRLLRGRCQVVATGHLPPARRQVPR
jgi:integrase